MRTALGLCGWLLLIGCQPDGARRDSDVAFGTSSAEVSTVFTETVEEPLQSEGLRDLVCQKLGPALTVSCEELDMQVKRIVSSNLYFHSDGFPLTMQLEVIVHDAKTPRTYRAMLTRKNVENWKLMFDANITVLD